jgi:hypothetical protein
MGVSAAPRGKGAYAFTKWLRCLGRALYALPVSLLAQKVVDQWRYTLEPRRGVAAAAYDDAAWKQGNGGFGTVSTPGARVGTVWRTKTIWLRKRVPLAGTLKKPALLVHHDEMPNFSSTASVCWR